MPEDLAGEKRDLDISLEIPKSFGAEGDEEIVLARDLMGAFVKAIKAFRFYPPENPTLKGFQETLLKKFQSFLERYNAFGLQIEEDTISFKEKVVYESKDIKTSLAFLFYKDGLRELRFMRGLEEWEIQGLMDIVVKSDRINQMEDDLVTLLWEKDFIHITYTATDEFLDETSAPIPENVEEFRANLVFQPPGHQVDIDLFEDDKEDGAGLDEILSKVMTQTPSLALNKGVYSLTSYELEGLRKEVESEIAPESVFNVTDILFEMLALETEEEPYQATVSHLKQILEALVTMGDFQKAGDLLKRVYIILKTYDLKAWQIESLRKLILDAGEPPQIERFGRILAKEDGFRLEDVSGYLTLLQRNSIKPLIQLLGGLSNSKTRRVICDSLSEIGKNAIETIAPFVEDSRWFLVRNIIYILGRIGKDQSLPYLQKALNHEDVRVRREAAQALGLIGGPKVIGMLSKVLTDEDVRIRATAAINLGKIGNTAGLPCLMEVVQAKDFQKKESVEIKAFFDAIGMIGSNESIPVLEALLQRKSWFGRGKLNEIRSGAASALAAIGTPEARAVLETGSHSKDDAVRGACTKALRARPSKESIAL